MYDTVTENDPVNLSFEKLRRVNTSRVEFFGHGTLENGWNVAEWGCAVAGETGELCNILKKMNRAAPFDPSREDLTALAADEIGDVLIYLDLIAAKLGLNLGECARDKFNAVSERYGYPHRL